VQPVVGLGFHSFVVKDVSYDALRLVFLIDVRQPGALAQEHARRIV